MIILNGKYNQAVCYSDNPDPRSSEAIVNICNQKYSEGNMIRIMPDVCYDGGNSVVGFTMQMPDCIALDIEYASGCGVYCARLSDNSPDLAELDRICHEIPHGAEIWETPIADFNINLALCARALPWQNLYLRSFVTLGGGNHFIEVDADEEQNYYLVIHSGGGLFSHDVFNYYKNKHSGAQLIQGDDRSEYLHDMSVCVKYAEQNRKRIGRYICDKLKLTITDEFDCVHHYFDIKRNIARHGAASAEAGERVIIPINMRDGCILATGKGNPEWNYSAPHGAGRIMSRMTARDTLTMEDYRAQTEGLFSTTVNEDTLDEAPMAYKPAEMILPYIEETVTIDRILKPVFNFKP